MLENQLIHKCKSNDGEAFRKLMKLYQSKLYGYLLRFSNCKDDADEMLQETLIKVWKGIKKYNEESKFSSWLFTIAHNVAMDKIRTLNKAKKILSLDQVEDKATEILQDEQFIRKEMVEKINESLLVLSEKQKSVFLLRQHGELSFKEIAKVTNEPLNTVLSHMRYAIKKIRKQLENENEPRKTKVI